jgi:hypothetical protein
VLMGYDRALTTEGDVGHGRSGCSSTGLAQSQDGKKMFFS